MKGKLTVAYQQRQYEVGRSDCYKKFLFFFLIKKKQTPNTAPICATLKVNFSKPSHSGR